MKDEKLARERLAKLRGEFLNWGVPDVQVSVTSKDELRGWIRALEWLLGREIRPKNNGANSPVTPQKERETYHYL